MKRILTLLVFAIILITGCVGNFVNGPTEEITFQSSPSGAAVNIDGVFEGVTPLSVELKRWESHKAIISLSGYEDANFDIRKTLSGGIIVSDVIIYGGLPLCFILAIGDGKNSDGAITSGVLLCVGTALMFDHITGGMYNLKPADISSSLNNVAVTHSIIDISLNPNQ